MHTGFGRKRETLAEDGLMDYFLILYILPFLFFFFFKKKKAQIGSPQPRFFIMRSATLKLSQAITLVWKQMTFQDGEVLLSITNKLILHNKAGLDAN